MPMLLGSVPDWIAALASAGSFIIAALILREARKIRENELFHSLLDLWGQYDDNLMSSGFAAVHGDPYDCLFDPEALTAPQRQVIWALINLLQYTWTLSKDRLLHNLYVRHQAAGWIFGLKGRRDFFLTFMDERYVDPQFRELFADITECEDITSAKTLFAHLIKARAERIYL